MPSASSYITDADLITGIVMSRLPEKQKRELIDLAKDFDHEEREELMKLIKASRKRAVSHGTQKIEALVKLTLTLGILLGIAYLILNNFNLI